MVVAPKNAERNLITRVAILPIVDGRVGLVRIYRSALHGYSWEIPRGFVDEGENNQTSAASELQEESGSGCWHSMLFHWDLLPPILV